MDVERVLLLPALGQSLWYQWCPALLQGMSRWCDITQQKSRNNQTLAFWQPTGVKFAVILLKASWKLTFCHREGICLLTRGRLLRPPTLQLQQHEQGSHHFTQRTTRPLSSQNLFLNSYLNLATKLYHRWSKKKKNTTNSLFPKELDIQRQKGQQKVQTQLGNIQ